MIVTASTFEVKHRLSRFHKFWNLDSSSFDWQTEHVSASSEGKCKGSLTLKSYLSTSFSCVRPATERTSRPDYGHEGTLEEVILNC